MTKEKHAAVFQLGDHDDAPEIDLHEDMHTLRQEKTSTRVTLLTVLIPCVVGLLLGIAYLDLRNRIVLARATDAAGVEQLAGDLDARMAALESKQDQLAADLEKSITAVQAGLEATQSLLGQFEASIINQEDLSRALASLDEKNQALADSLQIEIETLKLMGSRAAEDVEGASGDLDAMAQSLAGLQDSLAGLKKDLSGLSAEKIGKKELDLAVKLRQMSMHQELLEFQAAIEKRLDPLEKQARKARAIQGQTVAVQTIKGNKRSKVKPAQSEAGANAEAIEEQSLE